MAKITQVQLEDLAAPKITLFQEFLDAEPPAVNGERLIDLWERIYDEDVKTTVVKTTKGDSNDEENVVFPYEKLQAIVGSGGSWKWPKLWARLDSIERRGEGYREDEELNYGMPNKNPNIIAQRCLVCGGGPIGLRTAIELAMGGHIVTLVEKRREIKNEDGTFQQLGFTNRINRPHMWNFVRNDLAKLNGKELMSTQAAYPVFTEPTTSSIGIDELQLLLLKNALLLGVDVRLGVGYVNATIATEEDTMMPYWNVELNYDEHAAEYFSKEKGRNIQQFDCLIGADGPRSTVRETQQKHFGNIEKRKFMDCVGIVSNVQKVGRKRLKELGFEHGQEPGDMNRSKMVFKDFFQKLEDEADADIESLIYYKASHHNYTIIVPKRADLIKHGLSGKVYSFHEGRTGKGSEEKAKLKEYCRKILIAGGIPLDETLPNGGFVAVPNDCMAFDFAECWNTKKSLAFNLPPPGYSVEEDGDWEGRRLVPFVCLVGDALLEPFWPLGLGLKRGWQAMFDTVFIIDHLFDREFFAKLKGVEDIDEFSWDEHYEALQEQAAANFEMCNRLQISKSLGLGEYEDKGPEMTQLRKRYKDIEKPVMEVEIDPWTRYEPLEKERIQEFNKLTAAEKLNNLFPVVQKAINRRMVEDEKEKKKANRKAGEKEGQEYEGKELVSVNGRIFTGKKVVTQQKKDGKKPGAAPKSARRGRG